MKQFEYLCVDIHRSFLEEDLNRFGEKGWELVSTHRIQENNSIGLICILKREKQEQ